MGAALSISVCNGFLYNKHVFAGASACRQAGQLYLLCAQLRIAEYVLSLFFQHDRNFLRCLSVGALDHQRLPVEKMLDG